MLRKGEFCIKIMAVYCPTKFTKHNKNDLDCRTVWHDFKYNINMKGIFHCKKTNYNYLDMQFLACRLQNNSHCADI